MGRRRVRGWALAVVLLAFLVGVAPPASAAHKPFYKFSTDDLAPGAWEAHFVWLRSDHFNYVGKVFWEWEVAGGEEVDALFLDWAGFQAFRDGRPYRAVKQALSTPEGAQGLEGLTTETPYFLVLRNPGPVAFRVEWIVYADIDWRRWDPENPQPPGPTFDLTFADGSPLLARGESWSMAFEEPGEYRYYCDPHADMTGLVQVVPEGSLAPDLEVGIHDFGFHPEIIRIPEGTRVNWTNYDGVGHSVRVDLLDEGIPDQALSAPNPWLQWWPLAFVPVAAAGLFILFRRLRRAGE